MRLAIFGDSYANYLLDHSHLGKAWCEWLAEEHEVVNFGRPATAFQYSYELYLKNHKNFDYSVFVVTDPTRIYIKALDGILPVGHFFASPEHRESCKNQNSDPHILSIINSVDNWYRYWRDHEYENHIHSVLIGNLLQASNVLLIPGFQNSIPGIDGINKNLTDLQYYELLLVGLDENYVVNPRQFGCKRKCHFSSENNLVLFRLIKEALNKKEKVLDLNEKHFIKPSRELDYYITH